MPSEEERQKKITESMLQRIFNDCLKLVLESAPISESVKRFIKNVCHEPLEQTLYDGILNREEEGGKDTWEGIVEKGAALYYIHTKLNQKLERSDYNDSGIPDEFLLGCIAGEIRRRKKDFIIESESELKQAIYRKYLRTDYCLQEERLYWEMKDDGYDNFDDYVAFLCRKERNGLLEIHSFHHIWALLDMRRDNTFEKVRPTQDELYIFCFALALDYTVYEKLKILIVNEMKEEEGNRRKGIDGEERKTGYRKSFKGFTDSKRDKVLKGFLDNIETRLDCVMGELKGDEEAVLIPGRMLENVNRQLAELGFCPLTVKGKKGQKLAGR